MNLMHVIIILTLLLSAFIVSYINSCMQKYFREKITLEIYREYNKNKKRYSASSLYYIEYFHKKNLLKIDYNNNVYLYIDKDKRLMLQELFRRITVIHIRHIMQKHNWKN